MNDDFYELYLKDIKESRPCRSTLMDELETAKKRGVSLTRDLKKLNLFYQRTRC